MVTDSKKGNSNGRHARELTLEICRTIECGNVRGTELGALAERQLTNHYFSLNDELRFYVMHRISGCRSKAARRLLAKILAEDQSILVRHEAAFALGCIGDLRDLRHIRNALTCDRNSLVRHEAAMALGVMGRLSDLGTLRKGLDDPNVMVAKSCKAAITLIEMRYPLRRT